MQERVATHEATLSSPVHEFLASLRSPIESLEQLETLLLQPLTTLTLVPQGFRASLVVELQRNELLKMMPFIQDTILNVVLPTWFLPLQEIGHLILIQQFFCPSRLSNTDLPESEVSELSKMVLSGLSSLKAYLPSLNMKDPGPAVILPFVVSTISSIISQYSVDVIYVNTFMTDKDKHDAKNASAIQDWDDYIRVVCSIPSRVANILEGSRDVAGSQSLEQG